MLVLSRKIGEEIVLPQSSVVITLLEVGRDRVRLGITAPAEQRVYRREVWARMQQEMVNGNGAPVEVAKEYTQKVLIDD